MEFKKSSIVLVAALGAVFVLSSCGGNTPQAATSTPANTPVVSKDATPIRIPPMGGRGSRTSTALAAVPTPNVAQATVPPSGGEGGEGGVEAALVTYTDAAQRFSIGHPGTWTQDPSVTSGLKFNGGDDSMTLEFATLPSGGQAQDAMAYAKSDAAIVTSAYPGFKQLGLDLSTEVSGAAVLGFEATGKSVVTGKPYTARGDRYYIPMSDGRLAILTVLGPNNHYDREGVRDIALTLKSTK